MSSSGNTSAIYNTTRVADNQGHNLDWAAARGNIQKVNSTDTGYVLLAMKPGSYYYPSGETCGFPDFESANGYERMIQASNLMTTWGPVYTRDIIPTGTSWTFDQTAGFNPSGPDAFDFRVVAYNRMRAAAGYPTYVRLDRIRIIVDF